VAVLVLAYAYYSSAAKALERIEGMRASGAALLMCLYSHSPATGELPTWILAGQVLGDKLIVKTKFADVYWRGYLCSFSPYPLLKLTHCSKLLRLFTPCFLQMVI
jgi:hypothetical protein